MKKKNDGEEFQNRLTIVPVLDTAKLKCLDATLYSRVTKPGLPDNDGSSSNETPHGNLGPEEAYPTSLWWL